MRLAYAFTPGTECLQGHRRYSFGALFSANGELLNIREDVRRHNALDKIIGAAMLENEFPLRNRMLLLSAKRVMAGIPLVAAVGAPSSLAVAVAADFNVRLIGFLRDDHFNVYHGARRVRINRSGQTVRSRF